MCRGKYALITRNWRSNKDANEYTQFSFVNGWSSFLLEGSLVARPQDPGGIQVEDVVQSPTRQHDVPSSLKNLSQASILLKMLDFQSTKQYFSFLLVASTAWKAAAQKAAAHSAQLGSCAHSAQSTSTSHQ